MSVNNKPISIFAEAVPGAALDQFYSAMKQNFSLAGALMPDTHKGYSLPIGAVVATDGMVVPSWVGYDIGCGMCAYPLFGIPREGIESCSGEIFDALYREIPVGFSINTKPTDTTLKTEDLSEEGRKIAEEKKWRLALGSLGGGNHFIEIGADEGDTIWIVIHSGSRGVGHGIAQHYMRLASPNRKAAEGHFGLPLDSEAGQAYLNDQAWCLNYALENRKEMMRRAADVVLKVVGHPGENVLNENALINRNHNHVVERDGRWIHRKGATHAENGMMGVIPGNMRDGSFIVRGRGNPDSLWSSSHGAGRVLGRREAKESLSLSDFEESMQGIVARVDDKTLDESPFCYKDIHEVMRQQEDLVEVLAHVSPLINIKG